VKLEKMEERKRWKKCTLLRRPTFCNGHKGVHEQTTPARASNMATEPDSSSVDRGQGGRHNTIEKLLIKEHIDVPKFFLVLNTLTINTYITQKLNSLG